MTVRENVILMFVMATIIVGVAWLRGVESGAAKTVEGLRGRGGKGGRSGGRGGRGGRGGGRGGWYGGRGGWYGGRGGWFGGDGWRGFLPYWLLSRSVGSTISPSTVNVTQEDPYLTGVSRVTATIQLILTAGLVGAGIYLAYKWLVVKRR